MMTMGWFRGRKAVVTGGAGFIGQAICRRLISEGANIVVIDDLSSGDPSDLPEGVALLSMDVSGISADLAEALATSEVVFHLACRNIIDSVGDPESDLRVNALGTMRVAELAPRSAAFVYTSSSSVYGDSKPPFTETLVPHCVTPYSISKLAGEGYVHLYRPNAVVLRLSNVYGPGQRFGVGVANVFFDAARQGMPIPLHGDGSQTRDFTWIEDVVDAILLSAQRQIGGIYNIGTGIETSVADLAGVITRVVGGSDAGRIIKQKRPMLDSIRRRSVDSSLAERELGWRATTPLSVGLSMWMQSLCA